MQRNEFTLFSDSELVWIPIEVMADGGACDTVMPLSSCFYFSVTPSTQSQSGMRYEFSTGTSIPNLRERRCFMICRSHITRCCISDMFGVRIEPSLFGFPMRYAFTPGWIGTSPLTVVKGTLCCTVVSNIENANLVVVMIAAFGFCFFPQHDFRIRTCSSIEECVVCLHTFWT